MISLKQEKAFLWLNREQERSKLGDILTEMQSTTFKMGVTFAALRKGNTSFPKEVLTRWMRWGNSPLEALLASMPTWGRGWLAFLPGVAVLRGRSRPPIVEEAIGLCVILSTFCKTYHWNGQRPVSWLVVSPFCNWALEFSLLLIMT